MSRPFPMAVFKDLDHGRSDVVFCVQPRERLVRVERGRPAETAVGLQFHAEKRVVQTGKVVVVDAGIDECGGQSNLWSAFSAYTFVSIPLTYPCEVGAWDCLPDERNSPP